MTSENFTSSSAFDSGSDECVHDIDGGATNGDNDAGDRQSGDTKTDQEADEMLGVITDDPFVQDIIIDSITALEGISQALGYRIAVFHDEMLELLSSAAAAQANELRKLVEKR